MIGIESWEKYHEESQYDKPFKKVVNLINSLSSVGYTIIGLTGRNEKFRQLTTNWILKYKVDIHELLMRPDENFLKNAELKLKLIEDHFKGDYRDIHFLIDDNEDTILAFFKLGIGTLQVRNISEVENGRDISRTGNGSKDSRRSTQNNEGEKQSI
jgi:hypothetical protein